MDEQRATLEDIVTGLEDIFSGLAQFSEKPEANSQQRFLLARYSGQIGAMIHEISQWRNMGRQQKRTASGKPAAVPGNKLGSAAPIPRLCRQDIPSAGDPLAGEVLR